MFPPRYAGMEGKRCMGGWHRVGFPRATRGWKAKVAPSIYDQAVSPALRGDGRMQLVPLGYLSEFPPRYAGMEGRIHRMPRARARFPRATRGWKDKQHPPT